MRANESNEIIEFNVGGSFYTSSRTTLTSYPDSMLGRLVSGSLPSATDAKAKIFIDRDGPLFRYILNFLRDKRLNLPDNFSEYAQLRQEADFYQIEPIIQYLDSLYSRKLNKTNLLSSSLTSLNSISSETSVKGDLASFKGFYFTIVSKLYQGTLESLTGCIRVLNTFTSFDPNSKRFMNNLLNPASAPTPGSSSPPIHLPSIPQLDRFICECKFHNEEKIVCVKPCGLNGGDPNIVNICQAIVRLAKKYGITTGYWEDMFYCKFNFKNFQINFRIQIYFLNLSGT